MDTNEINRIKSQFSSGQWPQFLESLEIEGLRGWSGQTLTFQFPVVAIVGENGTGKSTILKAAASAYENKIKSQTYYPSTFFPSTHWDRVEGVVLSYRIKLGNEIKTFKISKRTRRWTFPEKRFNRQVYLFDISRTLPLDASVGYAKIAKLAASEISTQSISEEFRKHLSHILGRDYKQARFATSNIDQKRKIGILKRDFGELSQFHQGAGEDATLDLFRSLQEIPDYSLLLIDEIEASLHPRAQRRLIKFLLWLSRTKHLQIIVTTHSPYILEELPLEARILLLPGSEVLNVVYGVTAEFAMSRIDDNTHPELIVFVEDRESGIWLREIIASETTSSEFLSRLSITPVGPANVVQLLGDLGYKKRLPYRSIAFVDGDQQSTQGCNTLPGDDAPEKIVFFELKNQNWPNLTDRFGIGAGSLFSYFEDAILTPDHHEWTKIIGDRVLKSSISVWETLTLEWCRHCLSSDERSRILDIISQALEC
jgi:predicted ATP-dependent endonuclease of OLD family